MADLADFVSRSRNLRNHQNLEFSRKVEILAILAISGSEHDSGQNRHPEHFSGQTLQSGHLDESGLRGWSEVRLATLV